MRKRYLSLLFATLLICSSTATFGTSQAKTIECELVSQFKLQEPKVKLYITNEEYKQIKLQKEIELKKQRIKDEEIRLEAERLRIAEEQKRVEEQIANSKQEFVLTFYTEDDNQNGYGAITCTGAKLSDGMVASNYYPLGTIIYLEGYGEVTVSDTGGGNFSNSSRLDVFVARQNGEDISVTNQRALRLGKQVVNGYIK